MTTITLNTGIVWSTPPPGAWTRYAKCRGMSPDQVDELFFTAKGSAGGSKPGREYCKDCPVIQQCRQYGEENRHLVGVFGGQLFADRRRT